MFDCFQCPKAEPANKMATPELFWPKNLGQRILKRHDEAQVGPLVHLSNPRPPCEQGQN
jgi:hypothetical protein